MSDNNVRAMLGEHFAMDSLALSDAIEKKWSGGYEVKGSAAVITELWVFQKGAILGRAKADKMKMLARLFANKGEEDNFSEFIQGLTEKMLNEYGEKPVSFREFFFKTRYPTLDFNSIDTWKNLQKRKIRLGELLQNCQVGAAKGVGLGVRNPELVKTMWINSYETVMDQKEWDNARKHGLDLPEEQSFMPLDEMEKLVLLQVYEFVKDNNPDLMNQLGLK